MSKSKNEVSEEELLIYLNLLKLNNIVHKFIFGNKKNIEIPVLLSEYIVRHLLRLDPYVSKSNDKKYDAQKKINEERIKYYEIKATSSKKGTTTINLKNKADILVWAFFNFDDNIIEIKQLTDFNKNNAKLKDFICDDKIGNIKRNKKDNTIYNPEDLFDKVFKSDDARRTSISLQFFKWNDIKKFYMDTLKKIKNDN